MRSEDPCLGRAWKDAEQAGPGLPELSAPGEPPRAHEGAARETHGHAVAALEVGASGPFGNHRDAETRAREVDHRLGEGDHGNLEMRPFPPEDTSHEPSRLAACAPGNEERMLA